MPRRHPRPARLLTAAPALAAALLGTATLAARAAHAQSLTDKVELHASLNAAYGRSSDLPVFGLPTTGTSDYRVFTLQGRFRLDDKNQVVAQVFNRRLGTSPLASAVPDVTMQWAFFQHRQGDLTFKVGRNPLPRGLLNEVRYIGTVLPFFRPPYEVQLDAFDAIDGLVASYRKDIGGGVEFEQHAFYGGSEHRNLVSTATGLQIRVARTENMFGGQSYLNLPVANVRLGLYGARYQFVQPIGSGYRSNVIGSAEGTVGRLKLQTEHSRITGYGPLNDNRGGYVQGTLRITDRFSVAGQNAWTNRKLYPTNAALNRMFAETRTTGGSAILGLTRNSVLKFEHHWRRGYAFDVNVPVIASQSPTQVTLAPPGKTRYFLASTAISF